MTPYDILPGLLLLAAVAALGGWAWGIVQMQRTALDTVKALELCVRINDGITNRVNERITLINTRRPGGALPVASMAEVPIPPVGEQPPMPGVSTTAVLNDLHEVRREMNRLRRPDLVPGKRDDFNAYAEDYSEA